MQIPPWRSWVPGLALGAGLSFLIGCLYAYVVWDPPSNDWGNEKTTTTLLLVPVLVVALAIAWWARRPLRRGAGRLVATGRANLLALLVGALILPIAELSVVGAEWGLVQLRLPFARASATRDLAEFGAELKQADNLVLESANWTNLDWFVIRLAEFTAKPVFVVYDGPGAPPAKTLRKYQIGSGAACPPAASGPHPPTRGDRCLSGTDIVDFADWPATGRLLYLGRESGLVDHRLVPGRELLPELTLATLRKPAALPHTPYMPVYAQDAEPATRWRIPCFDQSEGPFPFGRAVHWHLCAEALTLPDVADRIFGPGPTGK